MGANYGKSLYKDYELLQSEYDKIKAENELLKKVQQLFIQEKARSEKLEEALATKDDAIEALKKEVLRLNGYLNADGTNSGLPTSKTPLSKKKVIPNSREKSGKKKGGQPGHAKSKMKAFEEHEVTEVQNHTPQCCPYCGGEAEETGKSIIKDELDYEVVVRKIRHQFVVCQCKQCQKEFHQPIPVRLKEENQYGSHVQALGLALMNIGNVSVNKTRKMIYGLSEEEINPTEGYLIKQQSKAAKELEPFIEELRQKSLDLKTLYWDDTVIEINGGKGCLRFYGDDTHALYTAHRYKNKEGLDEDGILKLLPEGAVVMHDHNKVNYNKEYSYSNIECNVHLLRDLQKTTQHLQHEWSGKLKELLTKTNKARNELIEQGVEAFEDEEIKSFFTKYDQIMLQAGDENLKDYNKYYGSDERALILRILEYKDNYMSWVVNFSMPFSNNLSERSLRGVKSKMKIAGQFMNEESAKNYAKVKSYIETCARNGINETEALVRLCEGRPYTVEEIFGRNQGEG